MATQDRQPPTYLLRYTSHGLKIPTFDLMEFVPAAIALAMGAAIAFLFLRWTYRSTMIPRTLAEDLRMRLQDALTLNKFLEEKQAQQAAEVAALRQEISVKDDGIASRMVRIASLETFLAEHQRRLEEQAARLEAEVRTNSLQQQDLQRQHGEISQLQAEQEALRQRMADYRKEVDDLRQQSRIEFENLAQKIFTEKTTAFSQLSREQLQAILGPLSENIEGFRKKVEEAYSQESKERFSLEARVKELVESSARISQEANHLAAALKGQAKVQGDWGETILERILEQSGLVRGREYEVQVSRQSEDGELLRPDVLLMLPDNRQIIIDSKVSLTAYLRFTEADTDADRQVARKQHLQSVRNHIDQLSGKRYETLANSLDFVMMFVPIEPAYLLAIQSEADLWAYAYARRILLVSPTNLIAVLKIIADLWKREQQNRNALEIARQGEKLYDKFLGFVASLEEVGKHLDRGQDAYTKAIRQLRDGPGNLATQALKLRDLGIKSGKSLPASLRHLDGPEEEEIPGDPGPREPDDA